MIAAKLGRNGHLATGASVYLASNLFAGALPFALLPVLTRFLEPAAYGQVAMFQMLVGGLGAVVGLNAVAAAARKYYDGVPETELRDFAAACLQILAASTLVVLMLVLAFGAQLAELLHLDARWLPWAVLTTALAVPLQLRLSQWQVRREVGRYGALQATDALVHAALALLLVVALLQGAAGRIMALVLGAAFLAVLALMLLKRAGLLRLAIWRPSALKEALAYGVPLVPHVAAGFVLLFADRLVVGAQLGLREAGLYMLAAQFAQAAGLLFDSVNKSYVPWLFERLPGNDPGQQRRIVRATYAWFALLLVAAGLAFAVGPWAVRVATAEQYVASGDLVGWLVLGQVFGGMYLMVTNYLFYAKRTGLLSAVTVASAAVHLALLLPLTRSFGAEGAAIAFALAMGVRFLLTWWAAQRSHPMPWLPGLGKAVAAR